MAMGSCLCDILLPNRAHTAKSSWMICLKMLLEISEHMYLSVHHLAGPSLERDDLILSRCTHVLPLKLWSQRGKGGEKAKKNHPMSPLSFSIGLP